ncbi:MAG TPA: hypothetical protein VGP62_28125 [Bryobacteraceae bacterium]|nr:hypothetical protein [Bryobacteraceae bacterium]
MSAYALQEISDPSLWHRGQQTNAPLIGELLSFPGNMACPGTAPRHSVRYTQAGDLATPSRQSNFPQSGERFRKPPGSESVAAGLLTQARDLFSASRQHSASELDRLKTMYRFQDDRSVEAFLSSHTGATYILINALSQLKRFFGRDVVFKLQVIKEDDEQQILYAVAVWRGMVEDAVAALENFDENWWLDQPTRVLALTFTYELA